MSYLIVSTHIRAIALQSMNGELHQELSEMFMEETYPDKLTLIDLMERISNLCLEYERFKAKVTAEKILGL